MNDPGQDCSPQACNLSLISKNSRGLFYHRECTLIFERKASEHDFGDYLMPQLIDTWTLCGG